MPQSLSSTAIHIAYMLYVLALCFITKFARTKARRRLRPGYGRKLVSAAAFTLCAVLCFGPFVGYVYQHNKSIRGKQSAEVRAEVTKGEWGTCGSRDFETMHPCFVVSYKYEHEGKVREEKGGFTGRHVEETYRPGTDFKVCYDPDNLENSSLYPRDYQCGT